MKNHSSKKVIALIGALLIAFIFYLWVVPGVKDKNSETASLETENSGVGKDTGKPLRRNTKKRPARAGDSQVLLELDEVPDFQAVYETPIFRGNSLPGKDGKPLVLDLDKDSEIIQIVPNWSNTAFLVSLGSPGRWEIYDQKGDFVCRLPAEFGFDTALTPYISPKWIWRSDSALVASVEVYSPEDLDGAEYPETDVVPERLVFYDYSIESETLRPLDLPRGLSGHNVRLEGTSVRGEVIFSIIDEEADYLVGGRLNQTSLYAFSISGQ